MPPTSRYLARILAAAEKSITASQLARVLDVPLTRAANVLRYWERAGYLLACFERHTRNGRTRARYSLTPKGLTALYEHRHEKPPTNNPTQPTGD